MNMNERIYYSNEAARRAMMQRNLLALIAAGLGLALGAILALVLAPRSGDQTRRLFGEQVTNFVSSGLESVGKAAQTGVEQVSKVANSVREQVEERFNHRS